MYRGAVCAVPPCFSCTCSPQQLFLARSITGPPPAISCRCSRVSYSVLRSCLSPSGRSLKAASPFLSFIASVDPLYPCALSLSSKTSSFFPSRGPTSDKFQKTGGGSLIRPHFLPVISYSSHAAFHVHAHAEYRLHHTALSSEDYPVNAL